MRVTLLLLLPLLAQAPRGMGEYQQAVALVDPRERIVALERFLASYGNGAVANRAREDVVRAMVAAGEADEAIGAYARRAVEQATPFQRTDLPLRLAGALLELRRALPMAEELTAGDPAPRVAALHGRIKLARGDREGARRVLVPLIERHPEFTAVALALAELEGGDYRALAKLTDASVAGEFSDELLDRVYEERFAHPVRVERRPEGKPGRRRVLVEFFTSSSCLPCQGAELAFDALLDRFPESEVVAIAHHVDIPGPDPLTHPAADAHRQRRKVAGIPTFLVDGQPITEGGTRAAAAAIYGEVERTVAARLGQRGGALKLEVRRAGGNLEARVRVGAGVRVALVERRVRLSGANAIRFHRNVVRQFTTGNATFRAEEGREWMVAAFLERPDGRLRDAVISGEEPR